MPVSVIMIGKKDGTAEPVSPQEQKHFHGPAGEESADLGDGWAEEGRRIIFVENKNTDRCPRNANFSQQQIFVANKDTNREGAEKPVVNRVAAPVTAAHLSAAPLMMALNTAAAPAVPELVMVNKSPSTTSSSSPVAIAPKGMTLTTARMIPMVPATAGHAGNATTTLFLAPCDSNGQITHFVLTAAQQPVQTAMFPTPNKVLSRRPLVVFTNHDGN